MRLITKTALIAMIGAATLVPAGAALAANPDGTGQPGVECDDFASGPAGFETDGFAHAEEMYAGSQDVNSNNPHSVSQYDVACMQVSQH